MNKIYATILALAILSTTVNITLRILRYCTCATDNQAYHSVIKDWGKTNAVDLSRVLTRMQNDKCKVGVGHE